jgi:hypothetical protein
MNKVEDLFKILYKIIKKNNIYFSLDTGNLEELNQEQLNIINIIKKYKSSKNHLLNKFFIYYNKRIKLEKNILVLPMTTPHYLLEKYNKYEVVKDDILDGFKFLNKTTYILYDSSLRNKLYNCQLAYIERIENEH